MAVQPSVLPGSESPVTLSSSPLQPCSAAFRNSAPFGLSAAKHRCHSTGISYHRWDAEALPLLTWSWGEGQRQGISLVAVAAWRFCYFYVCVKTAAAALIGATCCFVKQLSQLVTFPSKSDWSGSMNACSTHLPKDGKQVKTYAKWASNVAVHRL